MDKCACAGAARGGSCSPMGSGVASSPAIRSADAVDRGAPMQAARVTLEARAGPPRCRSARAIPIGSPPELGLRGWFYATGLELARGAALPLRPTPRDRPRGGSRMLGRLLRSSARARAGAVGRSGGTCTSCSRVKTVATSPGLMSSSSGRSSVVGSFQGRSGAGSGGASTSPSSPLRAWRRARLSATSCSSRRGSSRRREPAPP